MDTDSIFDRASKFSLGNFLEQQFKETPIKVADGLRFKQCPWCGGGSKHKLHVYKNDEVCKCFSCGEKGNIVMVASALFGVDRLDAARIITGEDKEKHSNIVPFKKLDPKSIKSDTDETVKVELRTNIFKKIRELNKLNTNVVDSAGYQYLNGERCISEKTLKEAIQRGMLAFLPSEPNECLKYLLSIASKEDFIKAGLWKQDAKMPGICYKPIIFFLPGCQSAEFRVIGSPSGEHSKSIRYGKTNKPYFWRGESGSKRVVVVEGFIDFLSMLELGWKEHIMGFPGCGNYQLEWFTAAQSVYNIDKFVIAFDNDVDNVNNPGQKSAIKLAEKLTESNINFINRPPVRGDINEKLIEILSTKVSNFA